MLDPTKLLKLNKGFKIYPEPGKEVFIKDSNKDWNGNSVSFSKTIGASSHSEKEREINDFYATEPKAVRLLLDLEEFEGSIWECACGMGHLSEEIIKKGYNVFSSDIVYRGYGPMMEADFLKMNKMDENANIITNPPYKYADEFILKGMSLLSESKKMALFLPICYLEGKKRKKIFEQYPPKVIYISSSRLKCAINGEFDNISSAVAYSWFVWEKGYLGDTIIKWFN